MSRKSKLPISKVTANTPVEETKIIPNDLYAKSCPRFYMPTHPLAAKSGLVSAARHNGSIKAGHWLANGEKVYLLDGNARNIELENLEVMIKTVQLECDWCGKKYKFPISMATRYEGNYCSPECASLGIRKLQDLTPEKLQELVWEKPMTHIAADYEVSNTTIRNRCIEWGLHRPPPHYWSKLRGGATHMDVLAELGYRDTGSSLEKLS